MIPIIPLIELYYLPTTESPWDREQRQKFEKNKSKQRRDSIKIYEVNP